MDILNAIGSIGGIVALLTVAFFVGRYIGKFHDIIKVQEKCPVADIAIKVDAIWDIKEAINASIIKVDTLWQIYIEDNRIRHSNPGDPVVLPEELKTDIKKLLNNDHYLSQVNQPTLLVIERIGLERFAVIARTNEASLGQVLVEVNTFVFTFLQKGD